MNIFAVNINTVGDEEKYIKFLTPERKERLAGIARHPDRLRCIAGGLLISYALKSCGENIKILLTEHGKPHVGGGPCFNISHSGDYAVCAQDKSPVGIDIEKIRPCDLKIAKRFFARPEEEYVLSFPQKERLRAFFEIWTLKESFAKLLGEGLSMVFKDFCVDAGKMSINYGGREYYFKQYDIDRDYKLSVCSESRSFPEKPHIFTGDELCMEMENEEAANKTIPIVKKGCVFMKKRIKRKVYNTDTATELGAICVGEFGDPAGYEEHLMQTKSGDYFLFGMGGQQSKYPRPDIVAITEEEAEKWRKYSGQ